MKELFQEYAKKLKNTAFSGSRGGRVYNLRFSDKDVEIYPGIFSHSKEYVRFLIDLSEEAAKNFPVTNVIDGFYAGAPITSDFSKLKTLAGSVRPLTYSPARLSSEDKSWDKALVMIDRITKILYHNDQSVNHPTVSGLSSSGAPLFTNDAESKLQHLRLIANNASLVKSCVEARDLATLIEKLGMYFLTTAQIRRQADSWKEGKPKKRKYVSFLGAYGLESIRDYDDSELLVDMYGMKLGTCRTRVVNAYSASINNLITALIAPVRDTAEHNYAFTFKHRTTSEKEEKFSKFPYALGLDATQYDASVGFDAVVRWISNLPFNDSFKELMRLFMLSPFYSAEVKMADGDPTNIDTFKYWRGLPSGIAFTSVLGKVNMIAHVLAAYEVVIDRVLLDREIISILKGDYKFGIMNMSDDTVLLGSKDECEKTLSVLSKYMNVEAEQGVAFLGDLFFKDISGAVKGCHSLESYLVNWFVAERSINTKLRPYAMYGARDRRKIFMDHPMFREMHALLKKCFKKHFNDDIELLEERYMVMPKNFSGNVLSVIDLEVLSNVEKLYYKYDKTEVSGSVYNLFMTSIPLDIQDKLRKVFT